jgi:hypothetical protein
MKVFELDELLGYLVAFSSKTVSLGVYKCHRPKWIGPWAGCAFCALNTVRSKWQLILSQLSSRHNSLCLYLSALYSFKTGLMQQTPGQKISKNFWGDTRDPDFDPFAPLSKSRLCCTGGSTHRLFGRPSPPWTIHRGGRVGYFWFMDQKMKMQWMLHGEEALQS